MFRTARQKSRRIRLRPRFGRRSREGDIPGSVRHVVYLGARQNVHIALETGQVMEAETSTVSGSRASTRTPIRGTPCAVVGRRCDGQDVDAGKPKGAPYFTDAAVLNPAFDHPPFIILGPGEAAMAHQTDEYCVVERIAQAAEIYRAIATDWCD